MKQNTNKNRFKKITKRLAIMVVVLGLASFGGNQASAFFFKPIGGKPSVKKDKDMSASDVASIFFPMPKKNDDGSHSIVSSFPIAGGGFVQMEIPLKKKDNSSGGGSPSGGSSGGGGGGGGDGWIDPGCGGCGPGPGETYYPPTQVDPPAEIIPPKPGKQSTGTPQSRPANKNWTINDLFNQKDLNVEQVGGTETNPLFDLGEGTSLGVTLSNIPQNGNVSLSSGELQLEVSARNMNETYEFPMKNETKKREQWDTYKASGNNLEVFYMEVVDPKALPADPKELFTNKAQYGERTEVIVTNETQGEMATLKITEPGYYLVGAKLTSNGKSAYDFKTLKVDIADQFMWLPVSNNVAQQVGEKMIVDQIKKGTHEMIGVKLGNSLKMPSAYNYKYKVTAIGSHQGEGVKIVDKELRSIRLDTPIPNNSKVSEVIEYGEGFLVSTFNNGAFYANLADKKVYKLNINSNVVNFIHLEDTTLYVATNTGLQVGELVGVDTTNPTFSSIKTINNEEIFGDSTKEIGSVKTVMNKIMVTPKVSAGEEAPVVVINKQ